jgi:hypothetical protein
VNDLSRDVNRAALVSAQSRQVGNQDETARVHHARGAVAFAFTAAVALLMTL